ncbi:hypothetical protein BCR34DRAFT_664685 [Clohesyomyces aquaticus]|uniref:Uncharacterized protein n=1 Tax=Clohesyomyces aquaticus TaxID=1231657 RepID=A0A1Y1ZL43_9PLEO|nr:hypothetical protein BCR34DRAFT_664685 [Clohesyomyces aquaticus]
MVTDFTRAFWTFLERSLVKPYPNSQQQSYQQGYSPRYQPNNADIGTDTSPPNCFRYQPGGVAPQTRSNAGPNRPNYFNRQHQPSPQQTGGSINNSVSCTPIRPAQFSSSSFWAEDSANFEVSQVVVAPHVGPERGRTAPTPDYMDYVIHDQNATGEGLGYICAKWRYMISIAKHEGHMTRLPLYTFHGKAFSILPKVEHAQYIGLKTLYNNDYEQQNDVDPFFCRQTHSISLIPMQPNRANIQTVYRIKEAPESRWFAVRQLSNWEETYYTKNGTSKANHRLNLGIRVARAARHNSER